jgi:hypothetical protein
MTNRKRHVCTRRQKMLPAKSHPSELLNQSKGSSITASPLAGRSNKPETELPAKSGFQQVPSRRAQAGVTYRKSRFELSRWRGRCCICGGRKGE